MLNLELINHGNEIEEIISLAAYVSNPIESLRYSKYINDRSIALEYIESNEINSKDNLIIEDLSWKMPKNNKNFFNNNEEFTVSTGSFYSDFKEIIATNKITLDIQGNEIPLYFKHKREVKEASVHCVKNGDNFVVNSGFLIENNKVYTNYKNYYEEKTGKYILYFISGVDLEGTAFNELLNLEPVIREASWEDIDLDSGEIDSDLYLKEPEGTGYRYNLKLNSNCKTDNVSENIFVKGLGRNLINILPPEDYSLNSKWMLRIQNGSIVQDGRLYKLKEYDEQPFNPIYGVLFFRNKTCFNTNSNVVKLPVKEVLIKPNDYIHITLYIHDSEENVLKAITTNPELVGTRATDTIMYEEGVVSWDEKEGFVELDFSLIADQIVTANFYYKADSLIVKDIDFNPFYNEELIHNKYYFYVKPYSYKDKKSLEWLLLDEDERIIDCSQENLKIEIESIFNENTVIGNNLKSFKETYCYGYENEFYYLELGEIFLSENSYLDEIDHFDVREKTFIKESRYKDLLNKQWKILQSKFGYGSEGQVVQKNNLLYVEVPYELLKEYSEEEVENMLKKHIPVTLDLVIEYIYPKSTINFNTEVSNQVTLNISWEEPGAYSIYRSQIKIKRDESEKIVTINSETEENISYVDTEVESGKSYYYWVRVNENPYSNTFGVKVR